MLDLADLWFLAAATSDPWDGSIFSGLDSDHRFGVMLAAIVFLTGIIISLAYFASSWASGVHRRRVEADLKRDMLDRGMSADEIVKVIESSAPPEGAASRWVDSWCKGKK